MHHRATVDWDANDPKLRTYWAQGLTGSQITGLIPNSTRSAIMGRVRRLGLIGRKSAQPLRDTPKAERPIKRLRLKTSRPLPTFKSISAKKLQPRFVELELLQPIDCRWPYGDGPFTFCGCRKMTLSSYCHHHAKAAHRITSPDTPSVRPPQSM